MCIYPEFPDLDLSDEHQAIFNAIFDDPPRPGIVWADVFALLTALGGQVSLGADRVHVVLIYYQENQRQRLVGGFPCLNEQEYLSKGRILDIRKLIHSYLSAVGDNPN